LNCGLVSIYIYIVGGTQSTIKQDKKKALGAG